MKFFKQTIKGSCNIIALQHVFSFFDQYPSFDEINDEIRKELPQHPFGNWLTEIGTYLGKKGLKTKLISNCKDFKPATEEFAQSLEEYKKYGIFVNRVVLESDICNKPVLINVDAFKIRKQMGGPGAHYVVIEKEADFYWIYDGNNHDKQEKYRFEEIYKTSLEINEFKENGMWLILE